MVTATHYDSYAEHRRYLLILASLFAVIWIALAINPSYRHDWMLENALVVVFAVGLLLTYKKIIFSRVSYTPIFVFLVLHEVGAHYTYAEVPYDHWFREFTGQS